MIDELHDTATLSDDLWGELPASGTGQREWSAEQLIELVVLAGWYRLISQLINVARVELEPWAARFPSGD